ncbi:MAG: DNA/RNA nuclease SfsA [Marinilabiliales bacterium]|nr:MAG: DNA/RNA nuclease SfsA [Marinilabiliales bacterium]
MEFSEKLIHGKLIKRYKRFLADVTLDNGEEVVAHCTNSGSMKTCLEEGAEVYLSPVNDPKRKTRFTWEMIKINNSWVGINTSNPNKLAFDIVSENLLNQLSGYTTVKREVKFEDSRFDVYAENEHEKCFIEVKNVTMKDGEYALFPDAVTSRGLKHLNTLIEVKKRGYRAVMLYIIQRTDIDKFDTAKEIDPAYAEALLKAEKQGVEVIPVMAKVSPEGIEITKVVPWVPRV